MVCDITSEKENRITAQKFNTRKDATLEILSHDMAALLVLMQQLTEALKQDASHCLTPAVDEILRLMERTCTEGVTLIRDFVDNEFMESANVELNRERTDLVGWLRTIESQRVTPG